MKVLSELDCFSKLGDDDETIRYIAALKISNIFDQDSVSDEKRGALRRLISGLGGSKENGRFGSYAVLKYILNERPTDELLEYDSLSRLIKTCLKPHADSKQEDGEAYLGQLLAYKAMVSTAYLKSHSDKYEDVALEIADLLKKRSYLNGECFAVLAVLLPQLEQEIESEKIVELLMDLTQDSSEKLMYLMAVNDRFPKSKTLKNVFNTKGLFVEGNAPSLASCVLGGSCLDSKDKTSFYETLCRHVVQNKKFLSAFWQYCCSQIASTRNQNVETILMKLFEAMLNAAIELKLDMKDIVLTLLNDVVIGLLTNTRAQKAVKKPFGKKLGTSLVQALSLIEDEEAKFVILKKLIFPPGTLSFDKKTKCKAVASLMNAQSSQNIKEIAKKLAESIRSPRLVNKDKLTALNLFNSLLTHRNCAEDTDWRAKQMKLLLGLGFRTQNNINAELADLIRKSFYGSLSSKFPRLQAFTEVLDQLVTHLNDLLKSGVPLRIKVDDEKTRTWDRGMKLLKKMSKNESSTDFSVSLKILTQYILLTVFNEGQDCELNLQDIDTVVSKHGSSSDDSTEAHWSEVLIDLLLNLLSKTSSSNRHIVSVVFKHVAPHMNDSAFMLLMNVMNPEKSALKDNDDDEEEEEDDTEEKEGESGNDSESEEGEVDDEEEENDEEDEDIEIEEASSAGESDEDPTYYENLQRELRQVLYSHDTDNESVDVDDIDEEKGEALNKSLGQVFRNALKVKKNRESKRQGRTSHFRCRVLDLLEMYIRNISTAHSLTLMPTLVELYKFVVTRKQDTSLQKRLMNFAEKLAAQRIQNRQSCSQETLKQLAELLQSLIVELSKASNLSLVIRPFLMCLTKFIISNASSMEVLSSNNPFETIIQETFDQFFSSNKGAVHPKFFNLLNQSNWEINHPLVLKAVDYGFATKLKFYKQELAFDFIIYFLKNARRQEVTEEMRQTVRKLVTALCSALESASGNLNLRFFPKIFLLVEELFNNGKLSKLIEKDTLLQSLRHSVSKCLQIDEDKVEALVKTSHTKNKWKTLWKELQGRIKKEVKGDGRAGRRMHSADQLDDLGEVKSSKKRKRTDARKLRKMSKRLRAEVSELEPRVFSRFSKMDTDTSM